MKISLNIIVLILLSSHFSGCDINSILSSKTEKEMKEQIEQLQKKVIEQEEKIKKYEKIIGSNNKKVNDMFN